MHRIATTLIALMLAGAASASETRLEFEVLLDGKPVGSHRFDMEQDGSDIRQVSSVASFNVKLLGITVYRYQHQADERWLQGCLQQINSTTSDNGTRSTVSRVTQAGCISSYAYWDPRTLLGKNELLNPQTGEIDAVRIEAAGEETVQVRGEPVRADRYRLSNSKLVIDLWYSKQRQWLQLESTTGTKRKLLYRLR